MILTSHFRSEEFQCRCGCGELIVDARLVLGLESIRATMGVPIRINSGYRCVKHNKAVGGAPESRHVMGQAADISGADLGEMRRLALELEQFNGLGIDPARGFLHLDVRRGPRVEWSYQHGKPVSKKEPI